MDAKLKTALKVAGLLGAGIIIGRFILPGPVAVRPPTAEEESLPKLARIARDARRTCEDIRPFLIKLEATLEDRHLSAAEGLGLVGEMRRLM
jgi:hypothetical protein